jgi:hypothetical protein
VEIRVRNKDDKRPVMRLGKVFGPKSETALKVSETEYRALKAVVRLEVRRVRQVPEKAPVTKAKAPRASAKVQGTAVEPTGAKVKETAGKAGEKE